MPTVFKFNSSQDEGNNSIFFFDKVKVLNYYLIHGCNLLHFIFLKNISILIQFEQSILDKAYYMQCG